MESFEWSRLVSSVLMKLICMVNILISCFPSAALSSAFHLHNKDAAEYGILFPIETTVVFCGLVLIVFLFKKITDEVLTLNEFPHMNVLTVLQHMV